MKMTTSDKKRISRNYKYLDECRDLYYPHVWRIAYRQIYAIEAICDRIIDQENSNSINEMAELRQYSQKIRQSAALLTFMLQDSATIEIFKDHYLQWRAMCFGDHEFTDMDLSKFEFQGFYPLEEDMHHLWGLWNSGNNRFWK